MMETSNIMRRRADGNFVDCQKLYSPRCALSIMHPMLGRIKPHETPYKSIFLENVKGEVDFESLIIIEDSIAETKKILCDTMRKKYDDTMLEDLRYIDYLLLKNGIDEYRR